ncbi:MAG: DUF6527 family protein [bacterium]
MFLGNSKLKVRKAKHATLYTFYCPGCDETHTYQILTPEAENEARSLNGKVSFETWTFNGDFEKPTFAPSLNYATNRRRCHLFLRDGIIDYCQDSWHKYSGQKIPLQDF